jgi:dynein heavy chain
VEAPSRDGAYIHGLVLEGAGWDDKLGVLEESRPKQLFTPMPVVLIRAVPVDKAPADNLYQCPVYFTERRFRWVGCMCGWGRWRFGGGLAGSLLALQAGQR